MDVGPVFESPVCRRSTKGAWSSCAPSGNSTASPESGWVLPLAPPISPAGSKTCLGRGRSPGPPWRSGLPRSATTAWREGMVAMLETHAAWLDEDAGESRHCCSGCTSLYRYLEFERRLPRFFDHCGRRGIVFCGISRGGPVPLASGPAGAVKRTVARLDAALAAWKGDQNS